MGRENAANSEEIGEGEQIYRSREERRKPCGMHGRPSVDDGLY